MATLACFIVALSCAEYALKGDGQIFTMQSSWVWWIFAAIWAMAGVNNLVAGREK